MADDLTREAERIVLGAMMLDPSVIDAVTVKLRSSDFADLRHGSIFAAIVAQYAAGADTGPAAVAILLQSTGDLGRVGGAPILHDLITTVPTAANATWYADQIAVAAKTRTAVEDATRLLQVARVGDADQLAAEQGRLMERWAAIGGHGDTDSWAPMDLDMFLMGGVEPITPTIGLRRRDGLRLLYAGKEHTVIGEMESGKTWFCAACAAAEIDAGNHVVYIHFEEPDAADLVGRLRALGISVTAIQKRLRFVAPVEPVTAVRLARLLDPAPSLVVFDGINEGMSLHRWGIREEDGAAMFRRHLIAPCLRVGAGTLGCDHVIKDTEKRGRYALGSIHKGNGITGSLILLENVDAFGRNARGRSHVYVTKDRPGQLRQHGRPDDRTSGKTYMGELVVDDSQTTSPELELLFWPPKKVEVVRAPEASPQQTLEHLVLKAIEEITAKGKVANKAAIRAKVPFRATDVDRVLTLLVLDDRLIEAPGRGVERRYTIPVPSGDQLSISVPTTPETRPESAVLQRDGRTDSLDGTLDPSRTDSDGLGRDQRQKPDRSWQRVTPGRGKPGIGRPIVTVNYRKAGWFREFPSDQPSPCSAIFWSKPTIGTCDNPVLFHIEVQKNRTIHGWFFCAEHLVQSTDPDDVLAAAIVADHHRDLDGLR